MTDLKSITNISSSGLALATSLLGPIFALNIWTLIIEIVMFYYRLPIHMKLEIPKKPELTADQITRMMPPHVRWKADNFNHLMEQPMNFYVVTIAVALGHYWRGEREGTEMVASGGYQTDVLLAWAYVGLRFVHSIFQCRGNVLNRFFVFTISSVVLGAMAVRGALNVASVL